jgi:hypothetical protein
VHTYQEHGELDDEVIYLGTVTKRHAPLTYQEPGQDLQDELDNIPEPFQTLGSPLPH